jgi:hypothetical protein
MALNYTNYFRVISASSVCQTLASELIMGWSIHCADLTCWVLALLYSFLLLIYSGRMGCSIITYSTVPTFKRVKYCMSMWSGIFEHPQLVREGSTGFMRLKRAFRNKEREKKGYNRTTIDISNSKILIFESTLVNPEELFINLVFH